VDHEQSKKQLSRAKPWKTTIILPRSIGLFMFVSIVYFFIQSRNHPPALFAELAAGVSYIFLITFVIYGNLKVYGHWNQLKKESTRSEDLNYYYQYKEYDPLGKKDLTKFNLYRQLETLYNSGAGLHPLPGEEILKNELDLFDARMSILKYLSQSSVVVGILGTFVGLVFAVKGASEAISIDIGSNYGSIIGGLQGTLSSLHIAFYTSIAGILASLSIGLGHSLIKRDVATLVLEIERLLPDMFLQIDVNKNLRPEVVAVTSAIRDMDKPIRDSIQAMTEEVSRTFGTQFSESIKAFNNTIESLNTTLQTQITSLTQQQSNLATEFGTRTTSLVDAVSTQIESQYAENQNNFIEYRDANINPVIATITTQMEDTSKLINNMHENLGGQLDKMIQDISNGIQGNYVATQESFDQYKKNVIDPLFKSLDKQLNQSDKAIKSAEKNILALAKNASDTIENNYTHYDERMRSLGASISDLDVKVEHIATASDTMTTNTTEFNTSVNSVNQGILQFNTNYETLVKSVNEHKKILSAVQAELIAISQEIIKDNY
jgi:hypothetical protein